MKHELLLKAAPFSGSRVQPFDGTRRYLSTGDLQDATTSFVKVTYADKPSRADISVRTGDVLFARMKGTKKVLEIDRLLADIIVSTGFAVIRPTEHCNGKYLSIYLKSDDFERQKEKYCSGAVQPAITNAGIKNLTIPFPPLDDQKRIAHLLGKMEGLIARRKQHLQQLDDLLKSVFLEMFGDPVRNEKGWDKPDFETIISGMRNGLSPSKAGTYKGRVYTLSAITGNLFQEIFKEDTFSQIHEKFFPTDSDFLVCRGNGNINLVGKGYFFPGVSEGVIFPDTIIADSILPDTVNKHFFEALWKTRFIRQQIESNARTTNGAHKINQGVIEKITIIQPPTDLQNQFAAIVEKVDTLKARYQQSLTDLERLYGALSQKAFKGELDLSRVPLPVELTTEDTESTEEMNRETREGREMEKTKFELPTPGDLGVLNSLEGRKTLLEEWLNAWMEHLGGATFSAQDFMETARQRLWELAEDEAPNWGAGEYDELKDWVFKALKQSHLTQGYDDANNRVQLKAVNP